MGSSNAIALIFLATIAADLAFLNEFAHFRSSYSSLIQGAIPGSQPSSQSNMMEPKSYFFSKKSFNEIGLSGTMTGVLNYLRLEKPSKIQALSFNTILSGKHCIVADQTGSGKTLAYLMPLLQRVLELIRNETVPPVPSKSPYIVVITPTTELALQVSKVAKSIAHVVKFRSACVTSVSDMDSESRRLRLGSELLVATPGRLQSLLLRNDLSLANVHAVVLDEADILFSDQSFPLPTIGAACSPSAQFIFTTATLPTEVTSQITTEFPDVELLTGPGLHRIAAAVEEVLVDCSGDRSWGKQSIEEAFENKRLALLKALESSGSSTSGAGRGPAAHERTIVFCNTIDQCRRVENALSRADRSGRLRTVLAYHGAVDKEAREANVAAFCRPLLRLPVVLVSTDRASRGLDFDRAPVDHVILFDFPADPSEYVRRVGRTGRAGRPGRATILVQGRQCVGSISWWLAHYIVPFVCECCRVYCAYCTVAIARQVVGASMLGKKIEPVSGGVAQEGNGERNRS